VAVLVELPERAGTFADASRHPDGRLIPGVLILRLDAPLYFFNANVARSEILLLLRQRYPRPTVLILDLGATSDLDTTTADMLRELMVRLRDDRIELFLAQVKGSVRDRMERAGLMELVGEDQLFRSVPAAVAAAVAAVGTSAAGRSSDPSSDSSPLP
jgi:MFS superfamily sulfate permease-like transporter